MIIFIPTIPSTGTWFTVDLIKEHSKVVYFNSYAERDEDEFPPAESDDRALIQMHFGIANSLFVRHQCRKNERIKAEWIERSDHTVIPVRDPLKAILTSHIRNLTQEAAGLDTADLSFVANAFIQLMDWKKKYGEKIHLFPVDLGESMQEEGRLKLVHGLFDFLGLEHEEWMIPWAEKWEKRNTIGSWGDGIDTLYWSRNVKGITEIILDDFRYLRMAGNDPYTDLKPFLKEIGYRDLMWWTDLREQV